MSDLIPTEVEIRQACDIAVEAEVSESIRSALMNTPDGHGVDQVHQSLVRAVMRALDVPMVQRAIVTRFNTTCVGPFGANRGPLESRGGGA